MMGDINSGRACLCALARCYETTTVTLRLSLSAEMSRLRTEARILHTNLQEEKTVTY